MNSIIEQAKAHRPNCALPAHFIQPNMVVCTGEDPGELVNAMRAVISAEPEAHHQYRCYQAWKFNGFTVVISGIGTGCIEPLLWELLDHEKLGQGVAKRLVMIGTAGYIADSGHGQVFLVDGAYPLGCAVHLSAEYLPLRSSFQGLEGCTLSRREEMSTDYYYAATPSMDDFRKVLAKQRDPILTECLENYWRAGRLISMESLQFYHFCSIYGQPGTQYVALRGVANLADQFHEQGDYSQNVLTDALKEALALLQVSAR